MSLRVFMTTDTAGGVWVYALSLCEALADAGVVIRLLALGEPSPSQRAMAQRLDNVELDVRHTRLEWMPQPWSDLDHLAAELPQLADRADCHLVHLNHLVHGHLDWGRPVVCVVHSCVLSWFEAVRGHPAPREWDAYRHRVTQSLRGADHVVAPSDCMLRCAERHYGPLRGSCVIANGTGAPAGHVSSPRRGVLAAGRLWDEAKNLRPLEQLAPRLTEPLELVGPRRSPAESTSAGGATDAQELPQHLLWERMRRASVFMAPAYYEPFGLGILEAARSGCALVLGDVPSLRENWLGAAVFVDPRQPEDWLWALEALLHNPGERRRLARAAQTRAARFTLERTAAKYLALYRSAVRSTVLEA